MSETQVEQARDELVKSVLTQLLSEKQIPTHRAVARKLPADFAYDTERDSFERFMPKADQVDNINLKTETADPATLNIRLGQCERDLFTARGALSAAIVSRQTARAALSRALSAY